MMARVGLTILGLFILTAIATGNQEGNTHQEDNEGDVEKAVLMNFQELDQRLEDEKNCSNRHSVPDYFWDWLLFPVAVDDLVEKLNELSNKLQAINTRLSGIDYDQIPANSGLNFADILGVNYEWLTAENPNSGGALVPFRRLLQSIENQLQDAITEK